MDYELIYVNKQQINFVISELSVVRRQRFLNGVPKVTDDAQDTLW